MSENSHDVAVVGGGVIGAACAHFLNKLDYNVTVFDRSDVGSQCSYGNCGKICPSHALPLAEPGVIAQVARSLFGGNTPFFMTPKISLIFWRWFLQFLGECRHNRMITNGRSAYALLARSRELYEDLIGGCSLDCEWERKGNLYVFQREKSFTQNRKKFEILKKDFGLEIEPISGSELRSFEPTLKEGLGGGYYSSSDANLRPDRLLASWWSNLAQRGVRVIERTEILGLRFHQGRAVALRGRQEEYEFQNFVFATGVWTPKLGKDLGCTPPIQPAKGYSLTMERPKSCPKIPMDFVDHGTALTPMLSGIRLGSILEFSGFDQRLKRERLQLLYKSAGEYLSELPNTKVEEEWCHLRSMTPNGLPRIGRCPSAPNVFVAAGHNMLGMSMAPATGELIAELLDGRMTFVDPSPYSLRQ